MHDIERGEGAPSEPRAGRRNLSRNRERRLGGRGGAAVTAVD